MVKLVLLYILTPQFQEPIGDIKDLSYKCIELPGRQEGKGRTFLQWFPIAGTPIQQLVEHPP